MTSAASAYTTLAAALGRGEDVIGRRVIVGFSPTTIIGVVEPIRSRHPDESPAPRVYLRLAPTAPFSTNLLVGFTGSYADVARATARAIQGEMGLPAPADIVVLADELQRLQAPYRGRYEIALLLSWLAAVLSVSGVFAVAAHVLARRRKEVAVRRAVGATGRNIVRLCLREVAWAVPFGVAGGVGIGVLLGRQLDSRLAGCRRSIRRRW